MSENLISVILSVHNEEKYILDCLQKIYLQSYRNFECIVVDDFSSDGTANIIRDLEFPRLKLIQNKRKLGLPASLNKAAAIAKGSYLARIDADEYSSRNRFIKQLTVLQNNKEIDVVATSYRLVDNNNKEVALFKKDHDYKKNFNDFINGDVGFCHGSVMIRKSTFERVGGYDERYQKAQDLDLWLRISLLFPCKNSFYICSDVLYTRRVDPLRLQSRRKQKAFARAARKNAQLRKNNLGENTKLILKADKTQTCKFGVEKLEVLELYMVGLSILMTGEKNRVLGYIYRGLKINFFEPRLWWLLLKYIKTN